MTHGAFILGCEGPVLSQREAAVFRDADPWGFILFARNVETPEQLVRLTGELRHAVGRAAPVLIDQEGGRVQRMKPPLWRQWLPPLDQMVAAGAGAERATYLRYRIIADELRRSGVDVNCAPLADVATEQTHAFLRNRCFGTDVTTVVAASRACAEGLLAGGVLPVIKHIPGHGRANLDTHLSLPRVTTGLAELEATDFAAFRGLADQPLAMTAHIIFEAVDPEAPATQSAAVVKLIRQKIGFEGLLMTDDVSMQALSGSMSQRSAASIAAGCDLVLHCNGDAAEIDQVVAASGRLTPISQQRADRALARRTAPDDADIPALEAELAGLLKGAALV